MPTGPNRMTYQRGEKEIVAEFYGLPWEEVDLPFPEWAELRDRYALERVGEPGPPHESDGHSDSAPGA